MNTLPTDRRSSGQRGVTLVELMVALVLGLLIAGAAVATLIVARQGFRSVDVNTQLRENTRFAASLIERIAIEAGFENAAYGFITTPKEPGLRGYNNALYSVAGSPTALAHDTRTASNCGTATGTACDNGSDILILRFWGVSRNGVADGSMVNCAGIAEAEGTGADPRAYSIFHIATGSTAEHVGEPSLVCTYRDSASGAFTTVPLVQGVESLQVLYGTVGVTSGTCSSPIQFGATGTDNTVPDTYLTAKELDGGGYCANNWARVRSLRIGLLVRSASNDAVSATTAAWSVLSAPNASFAFNRAGDTKSSLTTTDSRLRQQLVFTVHLRNAQYAP